MRNDEPARATVSVIGAGPAGLMAAEAASAGADVTVYDRMPSPARKFLLAGRGGLNLTHSEPLAAFLTRYGPDAEHLAASIGAFPPDAVRAWCEGLGQPTFVGSSGRLFPAAMKASPLLRAWLRRLDSRGVRFRFRHAWAGWDESGKAVFDKPDGRLAVGSDATVLALGGASWPRLGSDGRWTATLQDAGLTVKPLLPSNCGFVADWSEHFSARFAGQPLKRVTLSFGSACVHGEAVVTRTGLEGGAVYALSAALRDAIQDEGEAVLTIGLRPDIPAATLADRLAARPAKQSLSTFLRKAAGLSPLATALLREATLQSATPLSAMSPQDLAALIGAVPIRLTATAPIERAISSAGGLAFAELDRTFMLRRIPGVFVAGEMLDWEAPTGGYLLQGAFATGAAAGRGALAWAHRHDDRL